MKYTKILVIGGFMAAIAAIFQSLPVLLSEIAVILTILSALPIFIASKINPISGVLSYLVAAFLVMLVSPHEALFFLCTNGIVGLSLGVCRYYTQKIIFILPISALCMTAALAVMNFIVGIPIFGTDIPGILPMQLLILLVFSFIYNIIYYLFANSIYKRISNIGLR